MPLSAASGIPSAASAFAQMSASAAVKQYHEALRTRASKEFVVRVPPECNAEVARKPEGNGIAEPRAVIRKVRANGLLRSISETGEVAFPFILKNGSDRIAAQFVCPSALCSTSELVDQLQQQLPAERAQHAFNVSELEKQIAMLLKELAEERLEIAQRDRLDAFARTPSPSARMH